MSKSDLEDDNPKPRTVPMAGSMHNLNAATSMQVDAVRDRIAVLRIFDNGYLQYLSLSICSMCIQIFFETPMVEQRSG
jgi:hypothetical protein